MERSVTEIAIFEIAEGHEEAFITAYHEARSILLESPGCRDARMTRGIESPSRFILIAEWESVEAHEVGFRGTDRFHHWRALIGPHFAGSPQVEHFATI
ncbi:MAG: antibiotic biosynthesis monooxygenase [Actinobacteria bacterium]|nr:antibiotic biosynthesis monooxygenase [Actinomycetota bacterium]